LEILSIKPGIGDAKEEIPLDYKGEKMDIGFNPRYFIDALLVMNSEKVTIELSDAVSPVVLSGEKDPGYMALIMPMKVFEETQN